MKRNLHHVAQNAVNPEADDRGACLRIDVNITRLFVCRRSDNARKEPNSRGALFSLSRIKFMNSLFFVPARFVAQKLDNGGVSLIDLEQPLPFSFGSFRSCLPVILIDSFVNLGGKTQTRRDFHAWEETWLVNR